MTDFATRNKSPARHGVVNDGVRDRTVSLINTESAGTPQLSDTQVSDQRQAVCSNGYQGQSNGFSHSTDGHVPNLQRERSAESRVAPKFSNGFEGFSASFANPPLSRHPKLQISFLVNGLDGDMLHIPVSPLHGDTDVRSSNGSGRCADVAQSAHDTPDLDSCHDSRPELAFTTENRVTPSFQVERPDLVSLEDFRNSRRLPPVTLSQPPAIDQSPVRGSWHFLKETPRTLPIPGLDLPQIGTPVSSPLVAEASNRAAQRTDMLPRPTPLDAPDLPPFAMFHQPLSAAVREEQTPSLGRPYLPHILETRGVERVELKDDRVNAEANRGNSHHRPEMKSFDPTPARDLHPHMQYMAVVDQNKAECEASRQNKD